MILIGLKYCWSFAIGETTLSAVAAPSATDLAPKERVPVRKNIAPAAPVLCHSRRSPIAQAIRGLSVAEVMIITVLCIVEDQQQSAKYRRTGAADVMARWTAQLVVPSLTSTAAQPLGLTHGLNERRRFAPWRSLFSSNKRWSKVEFYTSGQIHSWLMLFTPNAAPFSRHLLLFRFSRLATGRLRLEPDS